MVVDERSITIKTTAVDCYDHLVGDLFQVGSNKRIVVTRSGNNYEIRFFKYVL